MPDERTQDVTLLYITCQNIGANSLNSGFKDYLSPNVQSNHCYVTTVACSAKVKGMFSCNSDSCLMESL